ncbi:helix-turn-helix domain-containing protein [Streptomyces sp. NBC_00503]|uniref:helix-turn-helix domain-containing protein n=1 Tax=Streptomyces sp. NBC_00503 TaxID=2903659 RepID=UPI002E81FEF6|nr:helix-turn-helix transcriptional regulator [Streptomyces sp. NBC_00503]WUD85324.1 helix-turn-helix transcriptional regulator [Streptomyces sp. NBC_00503]
MESTQGITEGGMWRLVTGVPDARLCEGVLGYRGYWLAMNRPQRRIEVPNATVTMAINFGDPVRVGPIATAPTRVTAATRATAPTPVTSAASLAPATVVTAATSYTSLVNGLRTDSVLGEHEGRLHGVEVHFAPWMAYTVFGTDMHELRSRTVPLVDLLGPLSHQLEDRLAQAPCWRARFALMDALLLHRLEVGRAPAPQVVWAWRELVRSDGLIPLSELMRAADWSARHLELRFREQIGQSPKTVSRVLRMRRTLSMLSSGRSPSNVAASCGFYDQAHLHRDFRAMTGFTPKEFLAGRGGGNRPVDRVPGQITSILL